MRCSKTMTLMAGFMDTRPANVKSFRFRPAPSNKTEKRLPLVIRGTWAMALGREVPRRLAGIHPARVWQSATNHGGSCRCGTARGCPRVTENCLPRGYGIWQGIGLALKHSLPTSSEICVMLHTANCWIGWQYKHWCKPTS